MQCAEILDFNNNLLPDLLYYVQDACIPKHPKKCTVKEERNGRVFVCKLSDFFFYFNAALSREITPC